MPDNTPETDLLALKQEGEQSLARGLLHIYRVFNAATQRQYAERGYPGLTTAHTLLIANIDLAGTRSVVLAERMGMTKQFAGRLVAELREGGYVTVEVDPTDGRATLVKATPIGWQFLADACEVRREIEQSFEAVLGPERMAALVEAVEILTGIEDSSGPIGQLAT
jgi:DNA-binding MarR family transcriptional regulator